jgi:hypothetical protein
MPRYDWIWLEEAFEERAAILHRAGDSEPAEVFERLAATAANVPVALIEEQQSRHGGAAFRLRVSIAPFG